ncbi:MAG: glycosyltransferase family 39 protein [Fibromonadales bacterium]|nr:glycosyltransferase family 39 protein [Fibromonadales bacterium]
MKTKLADIALAFFACAIPLFIFALPFFDAKEVLKKIDWYSPFYIFTLQFGIGALLFIKLFKDFTVWAKDIWQNNTKNDSKLILVILATLIIAIMAICLFWIEGKARVQHDEAIYLTTAQNMYHNYIGTSCVSGVFSEEGLTCISSSTIKPRGLSYLYTLGMPIFGTSLQWVYNFQTFILFLTIPIFFFALLAWLKNKWLALLATTLLVNSPVLLFYSRSASIEGFYILMFALSLLVLKWAYDRNTTRHWLLLALTLAFFAQTRSETIFCLFAFIGVVFYRNCLNLDLQDFRISRIFKHSTPFPKFLATLSFFCIPILCTLSFNRDSDLQGGAYGARGHLLENIIIDFKIMAFTSYNSNGIFYAPYFPYFTWFALFGLITLIILTIKEIRLKKHVSCPISHVPYKYISAFLLALSPQYLILFDSVSADLTMDVQQRFVLIILPAMSFLGALFIWQMFILLKNQVNPKILLIAVQIVILGNTLIHKESIKQNIISSVNAVLTEHYHLQKFTSELKKSPIFFTYQPLLLLEKGISAYGYDLLIDVEESALEELFKIYDGNVFAIENSACKNSYSVPKMIAGRTTRSCDRVISYFNVDTVLNVNLMQNTDKTLLVYKILSLNEKDKQGLLRIYEKIEPTQDSVHLHYKVPKDTNVSWKIKHYLNDGYLNDSPYSKGYFTDFLKLSQFDRDTNIWRLDIVDTISNSLIHSDFWQLIKTQHKQ